MIDWKLTYSTMWVDFEVFIPLVFACEVVYMVEMEFCPYQIKSSQCLVAVDGTWIGVDF